MRLLSTSRGAAPQTHSHPVKVPDAERPGVWDYSTRFQVHCPGACRRLFGHMIKITAKEESSKYKVFYSRLQKKNTCAIYSKQKTIKSVILALEFWQRFSNWAYQYIYFSNPWVCADVYACACVCMWEWEEHALNAYFIYFYLRQRLSVAWNSD